MGRRSRSSPVGSWEAVRRSTTWWSSDRCAATSRRGRPSVARRWSYESLLPLMRAVETDRDFADSPIHGADGPLLLHRPFRLDGPADPPVAALLEAAHAFGLPDCPDLNVPEPYGICSSPYNQRDGKRLSTAVAYLDPARGRPNLTIQPETPGHEAGHRGFARRGRGGRLVRRARDRRGGRDRAGGRCLPLAATPAPVRGRAGRRGGTSGPDRSATGSTVSAATTRTTRSSTSPSRERPTSARTT